MPRTRILIFAYIFFGFVSFLFPFVSIQPVDLGINLLGTTPVLAQPEDLIPNFNYAKFFEESNGMGYKINSYNFGIYTMEQVNDDIFFGISPGLPAEVDGAVIAKFNGTDLVPIKICDASNNCKFSLSEQGVHDMSFEHGVLFIPGTDPVDDWSLGNMYTYVPSDSYIKKNRTMPLVLHSWGSYYDGSNLFVATGSYVEGTLVGSTATWAGKVFKSPDLGQTWETPVTVNNYRVRDIVGLGDRLYAVAAAGSGNDCWSDLIYSEDNGASWKWDLLGYSKGVQCFPRLYVWNNKLLHIGYYQATRTDLIVRNIDGSSETKYPPFATAIQQNIFTTDKDGFLYAISQNGLYRTNDLTNWQLIYQNTALDFTSLVYWEKTNSIIISASKYPKPDPTISTEYYGVASNYKVLRLDVSKIPCNANFTATPEVGSMPLKVNFTGQVTPISGNNQKWSWDFNGDGVVDSMAQNPEFTYNSNGEYNVSLRVEQDTNSCFVTKNGFIKVTQFEKITTGEVVTDNDESYGVSCVDYNSDNHPDIFVANGGNSVQQQNSLYANTGNSSFTKISNLEIVEESLSNTFGNWADVSGDGLLDVYLTRAYYGDPNTLYLNSVAGSKFNKSADTTINYAGKNYVFGSAWSDVNNDNYLDVFVTSWSGSKPRLLLNNQGKFALSTQSENFPGGNYFSAVFGDYNNDGFQDLYVPNYDGNNMLYKNDRRYFVKSLEGDLPLITIKSASASWGDYDNDGYLDLFVSAMDGNRSPSLPGILLKNDNGIFKKVDAGDLTKEKTWATSTNWGDYNNDGLLDMIITGSKSIGGGEILLFVNNGDGTFRKVIGDAPQQEKSRVVSSCLADFDNDGDLDMYFGAIPGYPALGENLLFKNNGTGNWLKVKLTGAGFNKSAVGARIIVVANINGKEVSQIREIQTQVGSGSQNDFVAHFGLGDATKVKSVKVLWPSRKVTELGQENANQQLNITEKVDEPTCLKVTFTPASGQKIGNKGYYNLETNYTLDSVMTLDKVVFTVTKADDTNPPQTVTCPSEDKNCGVDTSGKRVTYKNFLISTAGSYKAEAKITQR